MLKRRVCSKIQIHFSTEFNAWLAGVVSQFGLKIDLTHRTSETFLSANHYFYRFHQQGTGRETKLNSSFDTKRIMFF